MLIAHACAIIKNLKHNTGHVIQAYCRCTYCTYCRCNPARKEGCLHIEMGCFLLTPMFCGTVAWIAAEGWGKWLGKWKSTICATTKLTARSQGGDGQCVFKSTTVNTLSSLSLIWNCVLKCLQCVELQFDTFFYPNIKWFVIKDGKIQKAFCDLYFEYSKGLFLNFSCPSIDLWPLLIFFFRKV